jgi:histidyl-tRNA synthetase
MIKAVTGTKDILPSEIQKWNYIEDKIKKIFAAFNYKEIRTPVFEETVLFARGIGEETDIVGKEMYTFLDRSQTSITLKPEMTASVARAFIEHSLHAKQSVSKLFYISPMFRQEKPQAGRFRQFHQFGGEALGSSSPLLDAEMIQIAYDILSGIGLKDLTVKINSLGVPSSREDYKKVLRKYLLEKKEMLSEESKNRIDKNILRIFDSKSEQDRELMKDAPALFDYLDKESKDDFEIVKELLNQNNIPFEVDAKLVRGLDYYTKTTFEIISGKVGAQSALCGGGRYDLLIEELGGKPAPSVGFAAGIERVLLAAENENVLNLSGESIDLYIIQVDKNLNHKAYGISSELRRNLFTVELDYLNRSIKAQMREANKMNARYALFLGGEEFNNGYFNLKDMKTGEQLQIPVDRIDLIMSKLQVKNYVP